MKKLCLLILAFSMALAAQDGKPNFSGSWELQVDKSDFGPLPPPQSSTTVVDHKEPKLFITTTSKTAQGDRTSERTFTTDGEENTNHVGASTWKSRTRWVEKALETEAQFELQGNKIKMKDRWELADNGKTLTSQRTFQSDMGEAVQKLIYLKK